MSRVTAIISALVICIVVCLSWGVNHYRDNAIAYKEQRDKNARELKLANAAITDMQMRQRDVAALDGQCVKPPPPPAWIMQPPPDWQTPLNGIISPSGNDW